MKILTSMLMQPLTRLATLALIAITFNSVATAQDKQLLDKEKRTQRTQLIKSILALCLACLKALRSRKDRGAINDYLIVVESSAILTRDDLCPPFTYQLLLLTAASRFDAKLVVLPGRSGAA